MNRDKDHVAFVCFDSLSRFQGSGEINTEIYDKVYEGSVKCSDLEDVYAMFNTAPWRVGNSRQPSEYSGRSLSVSDVIEVFSDPNIELGFYYCDNVGFKRVSFFNMLS